MAEPSLMSVVPVVIEGHADFRGLGNHLEPCCCSRAMLPLRPCQSGWFAATCGHGCIQTQDAADDHV